MPSLFCRTRFEPKDACDEVDLWLENQADDRVRVEALGIDTTEHFPRRRRRTYIRQPAPRWISTEMTPVASFETTVPSKLVSDPTRNTGQPMFPLVTPVGWNGSGN